MEEDFRALLLADSGVSALAGSRVNWGAHPQGQSLPAVVLNVVSDADGMTMQGPDGLWQGRVQADAYAETYGAAKGLAQAVIARLNGHRGGGFRLVEHVATRDSREGGSNEAEHPFRVSLDFLTHWRAP